MKGVRVEEKELQLPSLFKCPLSFCMRYIDSEQEYFLSLSKFSCLNYSQQEEALTSLFLTKE